MIGSVKQELEPVALPDGFDPAFQVCGLDDFAKLLEDCVHPRCAPDHERGHGFDSYDESFDVMIKEVGSRACGSQINGCTALVFTAVVSLVVYSFLANLIETTVVVFHERNYWNL